MFRNNFGQKIVLHQTKTSQVKEWKKNSKKFKREKEIVPPWLLNPVWNIFSFQLVCSTVDLGNVFPCPTFTGPKAVPHLASKDLSLPSSPLSTFLAPLPSNWWLHSQKSECRIKQLVPAFIAFAKPLWGRSKDPFSRLLGWCWCSAGLFFHFMKVILIVFLHGLYWKWVSIKLSLNQFKFET